MARQNIDVILKAHDQASATMNRVGGSSRRLTDALFSLKAAAIAAAVYGFYRLARGMQSAFTDVVNFGDQMQKTALATGLSEEFLSGLAHAAEISGTSFEKLPKGLKTFASAVYDANEGLVTYQRYFTDLNIVTKEADGSLRPLKDLFLDTAEAIKNETDETKRLALASKLFGRAGAEMIPLFLEGKEGIAALLAESEKLGIAWSGKDAKAAAMYKDEMTRLKGAFSGLVKGIVTEMLPALTEWAQAIRDWTVAHRDGIVAMITDFGSLLRTVIEVVTKIASVLWSIFGPALKWMWNVAHIAITEVNKLLNNWALYWEEKLLKVQLAVLSFWEDIKAIMTQGFSDAMVRPWTDKEVELKQRLFEIGKELGTAASKGIEETFRLPGRPSRPGGEEDGAGGEGDGAARERGRLSAIEARFLTRAPGEDLTEKYMSQLIEQGKAANIVGMSLLNYTKQIARWQEREFALTDSAPNIHF